MQVNDSPETNEIYKQIDRAYHARNPGEVGLLMPQLDKVPFF